MLSRINAKKSSTGEKTGNLIAKAPKLSKTACLQAMKYVKANGTCENKIERAKERLQSAKIAGFTDCRKKTDIKPPLIFIQNWRKSLRSRYLSEL